MNWTLIATALALVPGTATAQAPPAVWTGIYDCSQGATALTLTVRPTAGGGAEVLFHFSADSINPGVPEGCFAMTGTYNARHVRLQATDWLLRPPGYVTVNLDGAVSADGRTITGTVDGPGCSVFTLTLAKRDPGEGRCHRSIS